MCGEFFPHLRRKCPLNSIYPTVTIIKRSPEPKGRFGGSVCPA